MLVQFGNNWIKKIPRTAKLDEAVGRVQFGSPRNFSHPIISKLDKHVVLLHVLTINFYRVSRLSICNALLLINGSFTSIQDFILKLRQITDFDVLFLVALIF